MVSFMKNRTRGRLGTHVAPVVHADGHAVARLPRLEPRADLALCLVKNLVHALITGVLEPGEDDRVQRGATAADGARRPVGNRLGDLR